MRTERDVIETLRGRAVTIDEIYAACEAAEVVSRSGGVEVVHGRTDTRWRRRARGALQLDLFGEIEAAETRTATALGDVHRQAVEFLTSPWPGLLAWWVDSEGATAERRLDHGEIKASYRRGRIGEPDWPGWAWSKWRDGLHFERGAEWSAAGGWWHRPTQVISWLALQRLRGAHPAEIAELRRLSAGRGRPHSLGWRWYSCPAVLTPWGWHGSHYESERADGYYDGDTFDLAAAPNGFADRIAAWAIVMDLAARLDEVL